MNQLHLSYAIFFFGCATVVLSVVVALKFGQYQKKSSKKSRGLIGAIKWQLVGEAIISLGILVFAYAAHTGAHDKWNMTVKSGVRIFVFGFSAWTTAHLLYHLYKLEK